MQANYSGDSNTYCTDLIIVATITAHIVTQQETLSLPFKRKPYTFLIFSPSVLSFQPSNIQISKSNASMLVEGPGEAVQSLYGITRDRMTLVA